MAFERIVFDIETNGLINNLVDFTQRPLKLLDTARMWCMSVRCIDTNESYLLIPPEVLQEIAEGRHGIMEEFNDMKKIPLTKEMLGRVFNKAELVIGHNIIKYDLPVLQLFELIEYEIGYPYYESIDNGYKTQSTINGKPVEICDTLVLSKLLNPDRPSHALKAFGTENSYKLDFTDFSQFSLEMCVYVQQDTVVSVQAYNTLMEEKGDYKGWDMPYLMESKLADLVLKQELFGFQYDSELSEKNKKELDALLKERYDNVTPNIPPKPLNKGEQKEYTPPSIKVTGAVSYNDKVQELLDKIGAVYNKDKNTFIYNDEEYPLSYLKGIEKYIPPAKKKAKSGSLTSAMNKWLDALGSSYNPIDDSYDVDGVTYPIDYEGCVKEHLEAPEITLSSHMKRFLEKLEIDYKEGDTSYTYEGREYPILYDGCIKETLPASIKDLSHLKGFIISLGWVPSQWNVRDLTRDSKKKAVSKEKFKEALDRYVADTYDCPFTIMRLRELDLPEDTKPEVLKAFLLNQYDPKRKSKPIRVPTTPPFRVGATKDLCPNLQELADNGTVPFVKDMVEYFTYSHRRNSISGGIDDDAGEPSKGFESYVRADGRISTPCDHLATSTSRFAHKVVCNVPRVSSLFGRNMRALFQSGNNQLQMGYDFSSLENRIQGSYIYDYPEGPELAEALLADKPKDIHTLNSIKLGISRDNAKSLTYALLYGAAAPKLKKMLNLDDAGAEKMYNDFWDSVMPLKMFRDDMTQFWESTGKAYVIGIDGRKFHVRSSHSIVNLLFQSAGSLSVKYTTVFVAQKLESLGLLGDLTKDTFEISQEKVNQCIVYHKVNRN